MPETAYARDGDVHLAYQIVGDSGRDAASGVRGKGETRSSAR
jgi:hypothetical protein